MGGGKDSEADVRAALVAALADGDQIRDATKLCPFCAETIKLAAVKCKHCGSTLETLPTPNPLYGQHQAVQPNASVAPNQSTAPQQRTFRELVRAPVLETSGRTYRGSRWFSWIPPTLTLANDGIHIRRLVAMSLLRRTVEEHIAYHAVASIRVHAGVFFCDMTIETSGGSQPIRIKGLRKQDAREIQAVIRSQQQTLGLVRRS